MKMRSKISVAKTKIESTAMSLWWSKDSIEEYSGQTTAISGKRQEMGSELACPTPRGIMSFCKYIQCSCRIRKF